MQPDPLDLAEALVADLDALGVAVAVTGGVAATLWGEPRATRDLDLLVDLAPDKAASLVQKLEPNYYVSREAVDEAIRMGRSFNVVHFRILLKADLYPVGTHLVARRHLQRRRRLVVRRDPEQSLPFVSPEDLVVAKLRWYLKGGEVSDTQWRDVLGVLKVQGPALDRNYMVESAREDEVADLLARACREAGLPT